MVISLKIMPVPYAMYAHRTTTVIQPAVASEEPIFEINDSNGKLYNAVKDDVQALADCSVWVPVEGSEKKESIC